LYLIHGDGSVIVIVVDCTLNVVDCVRLGPEDKLGKLIKF
jgi:hypothetical protein